MKNFSYFLILAALILAMPSIGSAASVADLERQIEALAQELQYEIDATNERLDRQTNISGYIDAEYRDNSKPGTVPGFRMHHLSLFVTKKISDKWRFFSEIEFEDAPKIEGDGSTTTVVTPTGTTEVANFDASNGKIFVEAVNIDYVWHPQAILRIGRFFTPAGIWSVDHYPPFVPTQERPLHIRKIFPQLVDGVAVYGSVPVGESYLNYDVFLGNGEGNTAHNDNNSHKALGARATFALPMLKLLEVGATVYVDTLNNKSDKTALGVHAKVQQGHFTIQSEYARQTISPPGGTDQDDDGYYAQFLYDYSDWTFGYRYDFKDIGSSPGSDKGQTRSSLFANYHVSPNLVLKLEQHVDSFDLAGKEDVDTAIASIALFLD